MQLLANAVYSENGQISDNYSPNHHNLYNELKKWFMSNSI